MNGYTDDQVAAFRRALESIACLVAEGVEVMTTRQLLDAIQKEALEALLPREKKA